MQPRDCPPWEYKTQTKYGERLYERSTELVLGLRRRTLNSVSFARDSRPAHSNLFQGLTPVGCEYYAGHYRGESFRCLQYYTVGVAGDPQVGVAPQIVLQVMQEVSTLFAIGFRALDAKHADKKASDEQKLLATVEFACSAFVQVLTIHPYADGNGHAARFITWAILGNYGYWPREWTIEPRPTHPTYADEIVAHRNGNPVPLIRHMLQDLVR